MSAAVMAPLMLVTLLVAGFVVAYVDFRRSFAYRVRRMARDFDAAKRQVGEALLPAMRDLTATLRASVLPSGTRGEPR